MREALVAVFDTAPHADEAVRALEIANVPATDIRRYHKDDPSIPHANYLSQTGQQEDFHSAEGEHRGFWSWLLGEEHRTDWRDPEYAERDEQFYSRSIGEGNTVVAVHVQPEAIDRVMRVLEEHHPVALADTGAENTATARPDTVPSASAAASPSQARAARAGEEEQTIPLAEEQVEIGKRRVERPVHVRRYVVERPVEQQVTLHDERVEIERRRRPAHQQTAGAGAFEERVVEVRASTEEPVVNKTAAVTEEVVVRREETERTETVRDTVRKEEVEIERYSDRR